MGMVTAKICPRCKTQYSWGENTKPPFHRDSSRESGYTSHCIDCRRKTDNKCKRRNRDLASKRRLKHKVAARAVAKKHYAIEFYGCAVACCKKTAEDMHHLDYEADLAVIPLCKEHHNMFHSNWIER